MVKSVLVTGAAGLIGLNLCKSLLEDGQTNVFGIDNFYCGHTPWPAKLLEEHPERFSFKEMEVSSIGRDPAVESSLPDDIDQIYHLACPASPPKYQKDPFFTLDTCYLGTKSVLQFAKQEKARVLFASTSEIYGDPKISPQPESYRGNVNPLGIRACYDEGKRIGETLCSEAFRQWGVDVKIARIFNTYGPLMNPKDGRVISNFIMQALSGAPISIFGDGTQTRSFCFVDDTVSALKLLMNSRVDLGLVGPINIGNPHEFTILELAEEIESLLDKKIERSHHPLPSDDPLQRRPDISSAKEHLDWVPKTELRDGLERTISYFRQCL